MLERKTRTFSVGLLAFGLLVLYAQAPELFFLIPLFGASEFIQQLLSWETIEFGIIYFEGLLLGWLYPVLLVLLNALLIIYSSDRIRLVTRMLTFTFVPLTWIRILTGSTTYWDWEAGRVLTFVVTVSLVAITEVFLIVSERKEVFYKETVPLGRGQLGGSQPQILIAIAILGIAAALTYVSFSYQQFGPQLVVRGNSCGPEMNEYCYVPLLKGGFPLAYLTDNQATSVWDNLGVEDDFHLHPFILDVLFYGAIFGGSVAAISRARGLNS